MISQAQIRSQLNNCLLEAKFDRWTNQYQKGESAGHLSARRQAHSHHHRPSKRV